LEDADRAELVDAAVGLDPPEGDQPPALARHHELLGGEVLVVEAEAAHALGDQRKVGGPGRLEADVPDHCARRAPRARRARMVPLQRLTHVGICVSDMDRSLHFYRDCLGFRHEHELRVAGEPSDTLLRLRGVDLHAVYLARDGVRIELLAFASPSAPPPRTRAMNEHGLTHRSFRVADLDATLAAPPPCAQRVPAATGAITAGLLVGWATGGIVFGLVTDRLGRSRTLLLTMLTYAIATAACAFATDVWMLAAFRFVAALGIGGEWAAGASLVAEVVPERRRVAAGALLYTSSPLGIFLATLVNDLFTKRITLLAAEPDLAWRLVFLSGLAHAAVALWIRRRVREPEAWAREARQTPRLAELFAPGLRHATLGGLAMCIVTLVAWWGTN